MYAVTKDSVFVIDSGESDRHKALPKVTSKGLTTASKEGTNDEWDRRHMGQQDQQSAAAVVLPSSSSASAQASTYRPHAIVVNVVQVSGML